MCEVTMYVKGKKVVYTRAKRRCAKKPADDCNSENNLLRRDKSKKSKHRMKETLDLTESINDRRRRNNRELKRKLRRSVEKLREKKKEI